MKRTWVALIIIALLGYMQYLYGSPTPIPGDGGDGTMPKCSTLRIFGQQTINLMNVQLRYDQYDPELANYHNLSPGMPITMLSGLLNNKTYSLPDVRRSFIRVEITGTKCTGPVTTLIKSPASLIGNSFYVDVYDSREGGEIKDVKITAKSIASNYTNSRAVWTKTYSGAYLYNITEMITDGTYEYISAVAYSTVQYYPIGGFVDPQGDSIFDYGWYNNPVYNDGDLVPIGGGGSQPDPFPTDSIL